MEKPKTKVALISDIHGNSPALEAVLQDIRQYEVTELVMLGDLVNGVDPHGCVERLRRWSTDNHVRLTCIRGNAESYLLTPDRDLLRGYGIEWLPALGELIDWFEAHLTEQDLDWLHSLPLALRWRDAYLVHDSPLERIQVETASNPVIRSEHREWFFHGRGLVWDMAPPEFAEVFAWMDRQKYTHVFCGHTHWPFIHQQDEITICNVGSVGAPLDGDWRAAWALFEENENGEEHLSIKRVEYDLSRIHHLVDDAVDYPDFAESPEKREAFKQWYATGLFWKMHVPGLLPPGVKIP